MKNIPLKEDGTRGVDVRINFPLAARRVTISLREERATKGNRVTYDIHTWYVGISREHKDFPAVTVCILYVFLHKHQARRYCVCASLTFFDNVEIYFYNNPNAQKLIQLLNSY